MDLPVLEFKGTLKHIGEAHGESCREHIQELFQLRVEAAVKFAETHGRPTHLDQRLTVARACLKPHQADEDKVSLFIKCETSKSNKHRLIIALAVGSAHE